jgi:2-oxoglutarate dehydrogenase E2 component (dihydrolipoamide succinyltransferase)
MTDNQIVVTLPSLGEDVSQITVSSWLLDVGETGDEQQPLLEVSTDKVDTEVPMPHAGTLVEQLVAEGDVVDIGAPIAVLATPGPTSDQDSVQPTTGADIGPTSSQAGDTQRVEPTITELPPQESFSPMTPVPDGAVATSVIETATESASAHTAPLPRIRQIIAQRMVASLQTSAQLTSVVEVDLSVVSRLRSQAKADFLHEHGVKLSYLPFFVKAAIEALAEHPVVNAQVNADCTEITYHRYVHLGVAVDGPKGLMVPVVRNAQRLSIAGIATAISDAAKQVRNGSIRPDALTGGTFTITNTGSRGALFDTPILNQPQSAILGTGAVVDRVVPVRDPYTDFNIVVRPFAYLALTYDHRVIDGADAALYLTDVKQRLESGFTTSDVIDPTKALG